MPIAGKIDVKKINKEKLYVGKQGTYLDIVLIETPNDQYGNTHMIVQSVTQAERQAGVKGAILGNAKILGGGTSQPSQQQQSSAPSLDDSGIDSLPF